MPQGSGGDGPGDASLLAGEHPPIPTLFPPYLGVVLDCARNVMQGKAAGDEMSERLAEQTREIATLRAQLAAAPSLDVDDMGGMSLGESLGGELEAEALAPPPVAAVPDALTAEMRTKLARAGVLEGEVEELQQKVERLESELQAQDDAKGARPIHTRHALIPCRKGGLLRQRSGDA